MKSPSQATISDLAPEIILRIFVLVQDASPAGEYSYEDGSWTMGWIVITHVEKRWRAIALSHGSLWAPYICSFYNQHAIETFAERSMDVHPSVDLDLLYERSLSRRKRDEVLEALLRIQHCTAGSIRSSESKNPKYSAFPATLHTILLSPVFENLKDLDVFLRSDMGHVSPFRAPQLSHLCVKSDALTTESAPLRLHVLEEILSNSPRLESLILHRAVDTRRTLCGRTRSTASDTIGLRYISVETFDECLVGALLELIHAIPSSSVHVHYLSFIDFDRARECVRRLAGVQLSDVNVLHAEEEEEQVTS